MIELLISKHEIEIFLQSKKTPQKYKKIVKEYSKTFKITSFFTPCQKMVK